MLDFEYFGGKQRLITRVTARVIKQHRHTGVCATDVAFVPRQFAINVIKNEVRLNQYGRDDPERQLGRRGKRVKQRCC